VSFNWADWVILGIVVVSCLLGLMRGLIKEALSVANWIIALLVAVTFRDPLASLLINQIETHSLRQIVAFSSLFVTTLMVGALVNYLIGELVKITGLSATDRVLGMVFGFLRGFVVVMAILLLIPPIISIDQDRWWSESLLIPDFLAFEGWARVSASEFASWLRQLLSSD
jgi:membrane protein required for colicin V production